MKRLLGCSFIHNSSENELWTKLLIVMISVILLATGGTSEVDTSGTAESGSDDKVHGTLTVTRPDQAGTSQQGESNNVILYRRLLQQKRASQAEAVQTILALGSYEKQKKMITAILTKLFVVLEQNKVHLTELSYVPGDPFPTDETTRDALSSVLENTAFLGDIALRLPDITHSLMKQNPQWKITGQWGVGFSNDTRIFVGGDAQLLNLMAQELEFIERDPNYINPFRADTIKAQQNAQKNLEMEVQAAMKKADKERQRKEKKKNRGPRMSGARHSEL